MRARLLANLSTLTITFAMVSYAFAAPRAQGAPAIQSVASAVAGPVVPPAGYMTGDAITLRRTPRSRSPVAGVLRPAPAPDPISLLGFSGDFLRVRRGSVEGWATTVEVLPRTLAVVLDAKTGATIARVPVGAGQHDVVFSPDGTKAVVYGRDMGDPSAAYELRTSDFSPTCSITTKGVGGESTQVVAVFYGGRDRALYAVAEDNNAPEAARLAIVRVREPGGPVEAPVWQGPGSAFAASADGRLGFVLRSPEYGPDIRPRAVTIDVVDLRAISVRNTLELSADLAHDFLGIEPSADGSELYLLGDVSRLRVVDTATGAEVREVKTGWAPNPELALENICTGGRSLLLYALGNPCEISVPEGAWWISGASKSAAPTVACAVDTRTARYGIGDRELIRLGAAAAFSHVGRLPAILDPPPGQTIWSWTMAASPDGTRLVAFVSFGEEFCPC